MSLAPKIFLRWAPQNIRPGLRNSAYCIIVQNFTPTGRHISEILCWNVKIKTSVVKHKSFRKLSFSGGLGKRNPISTQEYKSTQTFVKRGTLCIWGDLHILSRYVACLWVSEKSVKKCSKCGVKMLPQTLTWTLLIQQAMIYPEINIFLISKITLAYATPNSLHYIWHHLQDIF